ncbi:YciI family protein [Gilvimarinus sp. SDUM040013]|uniref:YciI family protein n=1 Tax=Gilvimarinus gilvus TaxID=3058038 RepID=A0ABU4RW88_9GAMM|nr:YciI family protein [Gilvimarinus sp. SDUM040013]MDO3387645.1 YciI family protein [Gilvimarinus sp. SDUM040013]MDX6848914.1 YciI family protein [Gilvimarinus sp. SDUM040013]
MKYLVMTIRTPCFQASVVPAHKQFLADLEQQGVLELAGPFTDKTGGAYLISADSHEAAKAIAYSDPVHTTGSSTVTVYEWNAS